MEWGMVGLGAGLLAFGPEGVRRGLVDLGRRFRLSHQALGLWIVAPTLAAPFALVALLAAREGAGEFGAGALLGAAMVYVLGLAGLAALVRPARLDRRAASLEAIALVLVCAEIALSAQAEAAPVPAGVALLLTPVIYLGFQGLKAARAASAPADASLRAEPAALSLLFAVTGAAAVYAGAWLIAQAALPLLEQTRLSPVLGGMAIGGAALLFPALLGVLGRVFSRECFPPAQALAAPVLGAPFGLGLALLTGVASLRPLGTEALALLAAATICAGFFIAGRGLSRRDGLVLTMACAGFVSWLVLRIGGQSFG